MRTAGAGWKSTAKSKHGIARKTPCGMCDKVHDSRKEARRCIDLSVQHKAGSISDLVTHPFYPFVINGVPLTMGNGHKGGVTLDFSYKTPDGRQIAEDVKPKSKLADSRDWPLRKALFKHLYPSVELVEFR